MPVTYFQDTLFFKPAALDAPGTTAEFPVWENNLFATSTYSLIVTVTNVNTNVVVVSCKRSNHSILIKAAIRQGNH